MIPEKNIKYVYDKEGNKEAVIISIEDWTNLSKNLSELSEYQSFKESLESALNEVNQIKKGKAEKINLKEFLDEI